MTADGIPDADCVVSGGRDNAAGVGGDGHALDPTEATSIGFDVRIVELAAVDVPDPDGRVRRMPSTTADHPD